MKKVHWGFVALAAIFMAACSNEEPLPTNVGQEMDDTEFISLAGDLGVTQENIGNVVKSMRGKDSRSTDYTVSTIVDSLGQPSIYVVNFKNNGGFVLVSATKSHYPILAYNDEGHYNVNTLPPAAKFWQGKMVEDVTASFNMPEDSIAKNRLRWLQYETPHNRASRWLFDGEYPEHWTDDVIETYHRVRQIKMDSVAKWYNQGCSIGLFSNGMLDRTELNSYLTTAEHEQMLERALEFCQGATWYWCEEQWQDFAVILIRTARQDDILPNFLPTTWGQEAGFNIYFPLYMSPYDYVDNIPAGCATVAAGQIMYYHRWPDTYTWNEMSANVWSYESARLLYDIAVKSNAQYNPTKWSTTIDLTDIHNTFKNMGYRSDGILDGLNADFWHEGNLRPVFFAGRNSKTNDGHAWVCSGYHDFTESMYLEAYTFTNEKIFSCVYSERLNFWSYGLVYMNWGYDGESNGYYMAGNRYSTPSGVYDKDFKTILVYPNK